MAMTENQARRRVKVEYRTIGKRAGYAVVVCKHDVATHLTRMQADKIRKDQIMRLMSMSTSDLF